MQISGKLNLFVQDKKGKENKPFKTFSTTISSQDLEGKYLNKTLEVRFNVENIPQEKLNKLTSNKMWILEIEEGWLGVRSYKNGNDEDVKVMYVYINKASVKDSKDIQVKEENNDLPF